MRNDKFSLASSDLYDRRSKLARAILNGEKLSEDQIKEGVNRQVEEPPTEKNWSVETSWTDLIHIAEKLPPVQFQSPDTLGHAALDAAVDKSVKLLIRRGTNQEGLKKALVQQLSKQHAAKRSAVSAVRWLRDVLMRWTKECEICGEDLIPPWEQCEQCDARNIKPKGKR